MLRPDDILVGRYRIVRLLARGGMGAVYEARDERLKRSIALKETLMKEDDLPRIFQHEVTLLANLNHPALPKVFDHFPDNDGQYMVMELISGDDLGKLLEKRGKPFSITEVWSWYDQLLDALEYLHSRTILHRDIKPSNLKVKESGGIVLLDFGLAKGTAGQMTRQLNSLSVLGYTPTYAPLEQLRCEGTTPRSDLYSLGATMYHLLTNIIPTDAQKREVRLLKTGVDPLRPLSEVRPDLPPQLAEVLMQALNLEAEDRPASAAAMHVVLPRHVSPTQPLPEHLLKIKPGPEPPPTLASVPVPEKKPEDDSSEETAPIIAAHTSEETVEDKRPSNQIAPLSAEPNPASKPSVPPVKPDVVTPHVTPAHVQVSPVIPTPSPRTPVHVTPTTPQRQTSRLVKVSLAVSGALVVLIIFIWLVFIYISSATKTDGLSPADNNANNQNVQASPEPKASPTTRSAPRPVAPDPRKIGNSSPINQH